MGLFSKKKTAEDILKMIAELPDEERALVMDMINGNPEEKTAETANDEAEETPAESEAEDEPTLDNPAEETEEEAEELTEEVAEESAEESMEEAASTAEEAENEGEIPEEAAEEEPEAAPDTSYADLAARLDHIEETIRAIAQRLDAADSEKEEDDPFGMSIGAETKGDDQEDELERAKREAGFNF